MFFMKFKQLKKGEFLYKDDELSTHTFFMFEGQIELVVKSKGTEDEFKFSKQIDENDFFGRKSDPKDKRSDYARVVS
mgnify:CR=1 FL=1